MIDEIWKDIKGYEGLYQISSIGRLKTLANNASKKEKFSKPFVTRDGYFRYALSNKGVHSSICAHQLVAASFLGHKRCGMRLVVDHINGDKIDNRVSNLRLATSYENASLFFRRDRDGLSSQYVGVNKDNRSVKWSAKIRVGGVLRSLGNFDLESNASNAYQIALTHHRNGTFEEYWDGIRRVVKGYYFDSSRNLWAAEIRISGKKKYIGRFKTEIEAANAYGNALKQIV